LVVLTSSLFVGASAHGQEQEPKKTPTVEERLGALEKAKADSLNVFWKDGVRFESADKRYKFKLGGRIHYDTAFFDPDAATKAGVESTNATTGAKTRIEDGSEIRRARIELSGEVGDNVDWNTSYDFGGGTANFRNIYVGLKEQLFGASVRAGQFKEPYGLEQLTSSNHIMFMERSLMNAFVPAFNAGFMVFDSCAAERVTWALGTFRTGTDAGEVSNGDGEYAGTARLTGLPLMDEAGDDYVHLGLDYSLRSPTNDLQTFSSKPEANLAPTYVTTGTTMGAESVDLIGFEAAWVRGPVTVSGEYTMAAIDAPSGSSADPDFNGYYVQAGYFITGESRPYRKAQGCFDGIKPKENAFGKEGGIGAWEVAARLSGIDLADQEDAVNGGELTDVTLGVNWYLNPNTRVMLNYIMADLDPRNATGGPSGPSGDTDIIEFRVQFNF